MNNQDHQEKYLDYKKSTIPSIESFVNLKKSKPDNSLGCKILQVLTKQEKLSKDEISLFICVQLSNENYSDKVIIEFDTTKLEAKRVEATFNDATFFATLSISLPKLYNFKNFALLVKLINENGRITDKKRCMVKVKKAQS